MTAVVTAAVLTLPRPAPLHRSAMFGVDGSCRFEIRRWWVAAPQRWVAWLMLNPSRAGDQRDDPTALRVTAFSRAWGYDGWIGVNLYPLVAADPAVMWRWARGQARGPGVDARARDAVEANFDAVALAGDAALLRIVAFGAGASRGGVSHVDACLRHFSRFGGPCGADQRLHCLGVNADGSPLHPLARGRRRVPDDALPRLWPQPWRRLHQDRLREDGDPS